MGLIFYKNSILPTNNMVKIFDCHFLEVYRTFVAFVLHTGLMTIRRKKVNKKIIFNLYFSAKQKLT